MATFTPWGELSWLIARLAGRRWSFIGCVSHEERCLAALRVLRQVDVVPTLVRIFDEDPISEAEERASLDVHTAAAMATGVTRDKIVDAPLLASIDAMEAIVANAVSGCTAAIVDITSFPKRWFFVIARLMKEKIGF